MKVSKYNIYDEEKFSYIANTLTGVYIQANKDEILNIKNEKLEEFGIDEITVLEENGIIVDSQLDEIQLLRNAYNFCKYTNKRTTIIIVPSMKCNFNCSYCYEDKTNESMSEKIQNEVLVFLKSLLRDNQISELNVCWYGGEPTLSMDIVIRMSKMIIAICDEIKVRYHASIITNGYFINERIVDAFKKCLIKTAQVTLDGTKHTHNMRRKLIDGRGTYDKVKDAIFLLAQSGINVAVRVNLDKSNIHEYKDVYEIFAGKTNIKCYPAIVTVEDTQNICQKYLCYTHMEFNEFYGEVSKDMHNDIKKIELNMQPSICNCAAEHIYSYLVAPDGYLYKCLNDIGNSEYVVGHVSKEIYGTMAVAKYLGRDPFTEPECQKCAYIPICYGGCVHEYKKHNTHACKAVKFMYKKYCQEVGR